MTATTADAVDEARAALLGTITAVIATNWLTDAERMARIRQAHARYQDAQQQREAQS